MEVIIVGFKVSFYDQCKKDNRRDLLDRWDYELNNFSPNDISAHSCKKIFLKCQNGIHKSCEYTANSLVKHNSKLECKLCSSFHHWCMVNSRQDLIDRWDYELNKVSPLDVGRTSIKYYYFKCPRGIHKSTAYKLVNVVRHAYSAVKCECCNSFAQYGIDMFGNDFLKKYWDYKKNINIDPFKIPFRARPTTSIYINCQNDIEHGSYKTFPDHFISGHRCPKCVTTKFGSKLQNNVKNYILDKYNFVIFHEYECSIIPYNENSKHYMPFDNEVIMSNGKKLIIEVHGEQHYKISIFNMRYAERNGITADEALRIQKERDEYKKQYALSKGYYYLEIPYWTENDESYKILIDDKIKEILNDK